MPRNPDVLILARSGRRLAQAARAAGYDPVVVDLFGDVDTQAACVSNVVLTRGRGLTFDVKELLAALQALHSIYGRMPLVWGSGWENQAHVLAAIAQSWPLKGCPIAALFKVNDPPVFAEVLAAADIAFPALAFGRVPTQGRWLLKRRGSCGGEGVDHVRTRRVTGQREYLQRAAAGASLSAAFIAGSGGVRLLGVCEAFSLQAHAGSPYRFSAAVASPERFAALKSSVSALAETLSETFALRGLCGVDFMLDDTADPVLIDLNVRPPATFDLVAEPGEVFAAHMEPAADGVAAPAPPREVRAMAVCYAEDPIAVPKTLNWPAWVSDRPRPNTRVEVGAPICSVSATAASSTSARELLASRYGALMDLLNSEKTGM